MLSYARAMAHPHVHPVFMQLSKAVHAGTFMVLCIATSTHSSLMCIEAEPSHDFRVK